MYEAGVESVLVHDVAQRAIIKDHVWSVVHSSTLAPPGPALSSHHVAIAQKSFHAERLE